MKRSRRALLRQAAFQRTILRAPTRPQSWIKRHDTSLKVLLALVGLLFTLNEYLQRQHDGRIQRSLEIYERHQTKDVLSARLVLDRAWNAPEFWNKLIALHQPGGRLYYEALTELTLELSKDREVIDALFAMWATSAEASLCLIRGQCDQATICQIFWQDTQKYHGVFKPYFDARNYAWDENIQKREGTTMRILDTHCGDDRYFALFDQIEKRKGVPGAWDAMCRWYFESFNVLLATPPEQG